MLLRGDLRFLLALRCLPIALRAQVRLPQPLVLRAGAVAVRLQRDHLAVLLPQETLVPLGL